MLSFAAQARLAEAAKKAAAARSKTTTNPAGTATGSSTAVAQTQQTHAHGRTLPLSAPGSPRPPRLDVLAEPADLLDGEVVSASPAASPAGEVTPPPAQPSPRSPSATSEGDATQTGQAVGNHSDPVDELYEGAFDDLGNVFDRSPAQAPVHNGATLTLAQLGAFISNVISLKKAERFAHSKSLKEWELLSKDLAEYNEITDPTIRRIAGLIFLGSKNDDSMGPNVIKVISPAGTTLESAIILAKSSRIAIADYLRARLGVAATPDYAKKNLEEAIKDATDAAGTFSKSKTFWNDFYSALATKNILTGDDITRAAGLIHSGEKKSSSVGPKVLTALGVAEPLKVAAQTAEQIEQALRSVLNIAPAATAAVQAVAGPAAPVEVIRQKVKRKKRPPSDPKKDPSAAAPGSRESQAATSSPRRAFEDKAVTFPERLSDFVYASEYVAKKAVLETALQESGDKLIDLKTCTVEINQDRIANKLCTQLANKNIEKHPSGSLVIPKAVQFIFARPLGTTNESINAAWLELARETGHQQTAEWIALLGKLNRDPDASHFAELSALLRNENDSFSVALVKYASSLFCTDSDLFNRVYVTHIRKADLLLAICSGLSEMDQAQNSSKTSFDETYARAEQHNEQLNNRVTQALASLNKFLSEHAEHGVPTHSIELHNKIKLCNQALEQATELLAFGALLTEDQKREATVATQRITEFKAACFEQAHTNASGAKFTNVKNKCQAEQKIALCKLAAEHFAADPVKASVFTSAKSTLTEEWINKSPRSSRSGSASSLEEAATAQEATIEQKLKAFASEAQGSVPLQEARQLAQQFYSEKQGSTTTEQKTALNYAMKLINANSSIFTNGVKQGRQKGFALLVAAATYQANADAVADTTYKYKGNQYGLFQHRKFTSFRSEKGMEKGTKTEKLLTAMGVNKPSVK